MMERFILDTSVFTNPDIFNQFAKNAVEATQTFLQLAQRADAEFFIPGSVYAEFRLMQDLAALGGDFESVVKIRSPRRYSLTIPSEFLYELIHEVRYRIDRGLRIAEEHARLAAKPATVADQGALITRLRERYRETLRRGIVDSREDIDVLLLAYELDGVLLSADEGLRKWADKVGVKIILPQHLRRVLENLAQDKKTS